VVTQRTVQYTAVGGSTGGCEFAGQSVVPAVALVEEGSENGESAPGFRHQITHRGVLAGGLENHGASQSGQRFVQHGPLLDLQAL
jgi:hypothetical protein